MKRGYATEQPVTHPRTSLSCLKIGDFLKSSVRESRSLPLGGTPDEPVPRSLVQLATGRSNGFLPADSSYDIINHRVTPEPFSRKLSQAPETRSLRPLPPRREASVQVLPPVQLARSRVRGAAVREGCAPARPPARRAMDPRRPRSRQARPSRAPYPPGYHVVPW